MRTLYRLTALLLLGGPLAAQAEDGKLDVSLDLRARVETIDGQFRPNLAPAETALVLRSLLAAEYDAGPIRIGGEILDARVYFEGPRSSLSVTEVNAVEPLQAYVATDLSDRAKLIAGRFTLSLGSRRLITRNGFRNTINGFTGVQAILGDPKHGLANVFWTAAQSREPDDAAGLRANRVALDRERGSPRLFGAYLARKPGRLGTDAFLIRLAEHDSPDIATRDRHLWTASAHLFATPERGHADMDVEGAWQWGRTRETTAASDRADRRVAAGFVHAAAGYTFDKGWRPRLAFAFDLATGDGRGAKYTRFDTLYGGRGQDFGPSSFYGALTRTNIVSVEARFEAKPDARTETLLALRPLWLDSATDAFATTGVRDAAGTSGRHAGTQIEGRVRRALIPNRLRLGIGGAFLLKGHLLETAPNAPQTGYTHYGYLELTAMF